MDSLRRVLDVPNTCGRGEFDGCEGSIRPFLSLHPGMCVRIRHVTKNALGSRMRRIEQGKFSPLLLHALVVPPCIDRPKNSVSQVERRHSFAAPGLGGRVCIVDGDEDGNRSFS